MIIRNVVARASLADPGTEVERAREAARAGDQDWALWVKELDRGEATLIDMRVTVTFELADGDVREVAAEDHQVWVHRAQHPPVLAGMVAELASKDYDLLVERSRELGVLLSVNQLGEMYVTVELADDLLGALRPDRQHVTAPNDGARPGLETEPV